MLYKSFCGNSYCECRPQNNLISQVHCKLYLFFFACPKVLNVHGLCFANDKRCKRFHICYHFPEVRLSLLFFAEKKVTKKAARKRYTARFRGQLCSTVVLLSLQLWIPDALVLGRNLKLLLLTRK